MLLKTILNQVEPFKSFVYGKIRWVEDAGRRAIEVEVKARKNGRAICSGCGRTGPGYDRLSKRRFEFVPLWGMAVFLVYAMRRVDCPDCGVTVERVPWAEGKSPLTTLPLVLGPLGKVFALEEVASIFRTSWRSVFESVKHAVLWGIGHQELGAIKAIGVDEIQWRKGQRYLTLVYQIEEGMKRLLWVAEGRTDPERTGSLAIRYRASVDGEGNLRVHAGEVPFWPVCSPTSRTSRAASTGPPWFPPSATTRPAVPVYGTH